MADKELTAFRHNIGNAAYRRQYETLYRFAEQSKHRYSNIDYEKTPEELKAIKEKYKNGISKKIIDEMLDIRRYK